MIRFPKRVKHCVQFQGSKGLKKEIENKKSLDLTNYTASLHNDKFYLLKTFKQEATFTIRAAYSQLVCHLKDVT